MERNHSKVYINPNFTQRPLSNSIMFQNNMHVNPNFSQMTVYNNVDHNINVMKRRIFVNPNFIRPKYVLDANSFPVSNMTYNQQTCNSLVQNSSNNFDINCKHIMSHQTLSDNPRSKVSPPVSKSRYTLVRRAVKAVGNIENQTKSTIKISKYKTARLSYIKNNLHVREELAKPIPPAAYINRLLPKEIHRTKITFRTPANRKFIKHSKQNPLTQKIMESKAIIVKRTIPNARKKLLSSSLQINRKIIAGRFKKNNIPCPLFSKYGKCLRNVHGNCEFLHDKKHVSLCRKFLKGICHDTSCRFSHELSAKKMPTCYFYLKGNCTKNNCPYLHVKLNNKAKICNDFLKGYCDKGENCIFRHVNKELQTVIKRSINLQRQYSCSSSTLIIPNKFKIKASLNKKAEEKKKSVSNSEVFGQDKSDPNCRYFKEGNNAEEKNVCDTIKPSRCKLGTLPSFIKL